MLTPNVCQQGGNIAQVIPRDELRPESTMCAHKAITMMNYGRSVRASLSTRCEYTTHL